ncbi:MAG TPA: hybrid sensor histidine kinase/response regulator [Thioploca sp.]|nr:hybrid sensor histidine kinase/response regulator [Thioploca sp.]
MKDKPVVLIIDDSSVNLTLLYNMLEKNNFQVMLANSGEQGLVLAKQNPPDIILLDIIMGGWDGYETCRHMKRDQILNKIPVLFLSALGDTENKVRALQAGGVDYISKPFQREELLARVQTHIELANLRQHLEEEVANKTEKIKLLFEALQLSYDKAEQASILKTEFLRNVSHEFLTPMNIVLGMSEMLLEDTELTEEQKSYATAIMNASKKLTDILTNMLSFAQQFKGELKSSSSEFFLHEIIDNILQYFTKSIKNKQLVIEAIIDPELYVAFYGDKEAIHKILVKLVDNAIKFTEQGSIIIQVKFVEHFENIEWIEFKVIDTGIGIAEEANLFDTFYQIDGSSTRRHEGMGMGLAVAKMFTEAMGGKIGVISKPNEGSTFWFKIPLRLVHK